MAITDLVTADAVLQWVIIALFVGYFVYKEFPDFKRRMGAGAKREQQFEDEGKGLKEWQETINIRLDTMEARQKVTDERLTDDFVRLKSLARDEERDQKMFKKIMHENEVVMRALLSMNESLKGIGANGTTEETKKILMDYLQNAAHETSEQ